MNSLNCKNYKTYTNIDRFTIVPNTQELKQQFMNLTDAELQDIVFIFNVWLPNMYHSGFDRLLYTDDTLASIYALSDDKCISNSEDFKRDNPYLMLCYLYL